jgi:hypothetical protein
MVGKDSAVLASYWSGPHGGGWTRSGAGGILLGPFAQCIRAWRSEITEEEGPSHRKPQRTGTVPREHCIVKHVERGSGQSETVQSRVYHW